MNIERWRFIWINLILISVCSVATAGDNWQNGRKRAQRRPEIRVVPWGPTENDVERARARAESSPAVRELLKGVKYNFISLEQIYLPTKNSKPASRYQAVFYDYTNGQSIIAEGDFAGKEAVSARVERRQPRVSTKELESAFQIIKDEPEIGPRYRDNKIEISAAMPPYSIINGERYLNVGIRDLETGLFTVRGINLRDNSVLRYEGDAPPASRAAPDTCGIAAGSGGTPGTAGQYQMTVLDGGSPLWEMLIIRPAASSGAPDEGSGIEIRDVKYKGKMVLKRGHAPVLNVKYEGDICGPFRDWQNEEGGFMAPVAGAQNPASGIRILADGQIATTALETGDDNGNFRGVAIYRQDVGNGTEIVLVTEMDAGWYRYIMEWRFAPNGLIRPRYGFGATKNGCVCFAHDHHIYWRFDFDVVNSTNKVFQIERGRKFLRPITTEAAIFKKYSLNRGFVIQNSSGNEAYSIIPGPLDNSVADPTGAMIDEFGAGDFWLLRFKGSAGSPDELDDPDAGPAINLAPWVNDESLLNEDVVVWYGAHFRHEDGAALLDPNRRPEVISGSHVVGPDLRPIRW